MPDSSPPPQVLNFTCPLPASKPDRVLLAHGGGGRMQRKLITDLFRRHFRSPELARDHDGAMLVPRSGATLAFTTDAYVVTPRFFPGGDIGSLAVHGTVNDLAACGASARWMSVSFILEEGFLLEELERIVASMAQAARGANVEIVTGDTKVVERGKADGVYITTTGVGELLGEPAPSPDRVRPGDRILLTGPIGLHGMAIMSRRDNLGFESEELISDSAPLGELIAGLYEAGIRPSCLRDPTRGGVAATLSEIAQAARVGMILTEETIPIPLAVQGACEILGLDPLLVANEGKMLVLIAAEDEARALAALRSHSLGRDSVTIGEVVADDPGWLMMRTALGGLHMVDIPAGEELPRIC